MSDGQREVTPVAIDVLPTREGYDRWSELYDGEGNPLVAIEAPVVVQWLGATRGLAVLDVGCGTGRHTLRLASDGAIVTAVDFSNGMLGRAKSKPGAERVRFVQHDLTTPMPFEAGTFDRVVCALVVDHIPDLAGFFRGLGRVTRRDGFILVTTLHPAMMLKGVQARFEDPATGRRIAPLSCAHQVSSYVMGALEAGLRIESMAEFSVDAPLVERCPRAAKYLGWPLLLAFRLAPTAAE